MLLRPADLVPKTEPGGFKSIAKEIGPSNVTEKPVILYRANIKLNSKIKNHSFLYRAKSQIIVCTEKIIPDFGTKSLRAPAQSKCMSRCHKSHFVQKFTSKMPQTRVSILRKHRPSHLP